jgi:hypothetical protein
LLKPKVDSLGAVSTVNKQRRYISHLNRYIDQCICPIAIKATL